MRKKMIILALLLSMLMPNFQVFAAVQDVEITANVTRPEIYYKINITIVGAGNVYINKAEALEGDVIKITPISLAGSKFVRFEGCDASGEFIMPANDVNVTAYFEEDEKPTNTPTSAPIHMHTRTKKTIDATCTENGKSWEECECGDKTNATVIPALGHDLGEFIIDTPATCTTDGSKHRDCERENCSYTEYEYIPAKEHLTVYGGRTESHEECSRCGLILSTAHTMVKEVIFAGSCTEVAEYKHSCYCGYSYTEKGEVEGHNHTVTVTEPTCLDSGYSNHLCEKCGDTYKDNEMPALGHLFSDWVTIKEPTYDENGLKEHTCKRCGCKETGIISMLEKPEHIHDFSSYKVVEPTCTENGWTIYICSCGSQYTDDEEEALGHDWTEWTVRIEPACTSFGEEFIECRRCGIERTNELPLLGHSIIENHEEWPVVKEATCTEPGIRCMECVRHDIREEEEIPALGHDFDTGEYFPPTKDESRGYTKYTCKRPNCEEFYIVWDEPTPISTPTDIPDPTPELSPEPMPEPTDIPDEILEDRQAKLRAITIGATGTASVGVFLLFILLLLIRRKRKEEEEYELTEEEMVELERQLEEEIIKEE